MKAKDEVENDPILNSHGKRHGMGAMKGVMLGTRWNP